MEKSNFWSIGLRNGLMAGVAICILSLVFYLLGYDATDPESSGSMSGLSILFTIGALAWATHSAVSTYRKEQRQAEKQALSFDVEAPVDAQATGEKLGFGRILGIGSLIGTVSGIVQGLYTFVFFTFISPEMITDIRRQAVKEWQKSGMNEEQIEQAMDMAGFFMSAEGTSMMAVLMGLIFGAIIGVVAALFMSDK